MNFRNSKNRKGFSLMEMMIAMFIFILMIVSATAAFTSIFNGRRGARLIQRDTEGARTAIETMAKNIRMSSFVKVTGNTLTMHNNNAPESCVGYQFSSGALKTGSRSVTGDSDECSSGYSLNDNLISSGVTGSFSFVGTTTSPQHVGRATIRMMVGAGSIPIQTTVSFRDYVGTLQ